MFIIVFVKVNGLERKKNEQGLEKDVALANYGS